MNFLRIGLRMLRLRLMRFRKKSILITFWSEDGMTEPTDEYFRLFKTELFLFIMPAEIIRVQKTAHAELAPMCLDKRPGYFIWLSLTNFLKLKKFCMTFEETVIDEIAWIRICDIGVFYRGAKIGRSSIGEPAAISRGNHSAVWRL